MNTKIVISFAALALGAFAMTSTPATAGSKASAQKQLKKILGSHIWSGRRIGPDVREAAGNRNMAVFDRRTKILSPARCSFITYRGERAITCESS